MHYLTTVEPQAQPRYISYIGIMSVDYHFAAVRKSSRTAWLHFPRQANSRILFSMGVEVTWSCLTTRIFTLINTCWLATQSRDWRTQTANDSSSHIVSSVSYSLLSFVPHRAAASQLLKFCQDISFCVAITCLIYATTFNKDGNRVSPDLYPSYERPTRTADPK